MGMYVCMCVCVCTCMLWGDEEGVGLLLSGAAFSHPHCCLTWRRVESREENHSHTCKQSVYSSLCSSIRPVNIPEHPPCAGDQGCVGEASMCSQDAESNGTVGEQRSRSVSPGCLRREKPHLAGESEEVAFEPN